MTGGSARATGFVALLIAMSLAASGIARADTVTIGSTSLSTTSGFAVVGAGQGNPVFQGDAASGYTLSAPVSGTLTSWSFNSAGVDNGKQFALRVLRPADGTGTSWAAVATSAAQAVSGGGPGLDVRQGPFSISLPVQAGDRIALQAVDDVDVPTEAGSIGQDGIRFFTGPFGDGTTASIDPASTADNGQVVPIQATLQSIPTPPPPPSLPAPTNTHQPQVDGTAQAGQTLRCDGDTWVTHGHAIFTYAWYETQFVAPPHGAIHRVTAEVANGLTRSFVVPDYVPGATLYCAATASDAGGTSAPADSSNAVTVLPTVPSLSLATQSLHSSSSPLLTASLDSHGQTVFSCSTGNWRHFPTRYRYEWYATAGPTSPATSATLVGTGSKLTKTSRLELQWLFCRVIATNAAPGQGTASTTRQFISEPDFGLHVNAMEITQGIQTPELPPTRSALDPAAERVVYSGVLMPWNGQPNTCQNTPPGCNNPIIQNRVELAQGHATVVRVYLNSVLPIGNHAVPPVLLTAVRGGRQLAPGPIQAVETPSAAAIPQGPLGAPPTTAARLGQGTAYSFFLPPDWTHGDVTFEAQAGNGSPARATLHGSCTACQERTLELGPEHFNPTTSIHIDQLDFTAGHILPLPCGATPNCDPSQIDPAWAEVQAVTADPIDVYPESTVLDGNGYINATSHSETSFPNCLLGCTWSRTADVTDPSHPFYSWQNSALMGIVVSWADSNDNLSSHYPFAMVPSNFYNCCYAGGVTSGETYNGTVNLVQDIPRVLYGDAQPVSLSVDNRAVSGIAHELHHGLGRPHEDQVCNGQLPANGYSENWPPNNDGLLDGIGLDTSTGPPFRTIASNSTAQPYPVYDFMSYCPLPANQPNGGLEQNHWITVRNWNRDVEFHAPTPTRAADGGGVQGLRLRLPARAADARTVSVIAVDEVGVGVAEIEQVASDTGAVTPIRPGATYTLAGLDASGQVVTRAGAVAALEHADRSSPGVILVGRLAAAGLHGVELLRNGAVIARRLASAHPPTVSRVAAHATAALGVGRAVALRWRSGDPDGGARQATVRYSANGGRTWRTVYIGPDHGSATLPSAFLSASRTAFVRLYVSDGFNEAIATSAKFVAPGAPPMLQITSSASADRVAAGAALDLTASAVDDTGARLGGRSVVWRLGRTVLARGAAVAITNLAAGRHRITVSARDRHGRTSSRTVLVTLRAAPPVLTELKVPAHVSSRAKVVSLRLAALTPVTLMIGRSRRVISARSKLVRVSVRPGRSTVSLTLVLRSGTYGAEIPVRIAR